MAATASEPEIGRVGENVFPASGVMIPADTALAAAS
jgi:hypothetical protein